MSAINDTKVNWIIEALGDGSFWRATPRGSSLGVWVCDIDLATTYGDLATARAMLTRVKDRYDPTHTAVLSSVAISDEEY